MSRGEIEIKRNTRSRTLRDSVRYYDRYYNLNYYLKRDVISLKATVPNNFVPLNLKPKLVADFSWATFTHIIRVIDTPASRSQVILRPNRSCLGLLERLRKKKYREKKDRKIRLVCDRVPMRFYISRILPCEAKNSHVIHRRGVKSVGGQFDELPRSVELRRG